MSPPQADQAAPPQNLIGMLIPEGSIPSFSEQFEPNIVDSAVKSDLLALSTVIGERKYFAMRDNLQIVANLLYKVRRQCEE